MAVTVINRKGKQVTLLNPAEKGAKYARELKMGVRETNKGLLKTDRNGNLSSLNDTQKAYRSGYLDAQKDSAKAYKARQEKKNRR